MERERNFKYNTVSRTNNMNKKTKINEKQNTFNKQKIRYKITKKYIKKLINSLLYLFQKISY